MLEGMQKETRSEFRSMRAEMSREFQAVRAEMNGGLQAVRAEMDQRFEAMRADMDARFEQTKRENAAAHAETRRQTEVGLEAFFVPKLEAIVETIALLDERVTRETADIRHEMRRGFAETHDLLRFAYTDLDGRVRKLEGTR